MKLRVITIISAAFAIVLVSGSQIEIATGQEPSPTPESDSTPLPVPTPTPTASGPSIQSASPDSVEPRLRVAPNRGFDPDDFTVAFFDLPDLVRAVFTRSWDLPLNFHLDCFGESFPYRGCQLVPELSDGANWSARWEGTLVVPRTGEYTFSIAERDDGARILIDGVQIADNGWNYPSPDELPSPQTVTLSEGRHEIVIDYEQRVQFLAILQLRWDGPGFEEEVIPVFEPPEPPPHSTSRYWQRVNVTQSGLDRARLSLLGCQEALKENGSINVILSFGRPGLRGGEFGAFLPATRGVFVTLDQIANGAREYMTGYWSCSEGIEGSRLTLGIGVANTGLASEPGEIAREHGQAWGEMIRDLRRWRLRAECTVDGFKRFCNFASRIGVAGAINIEAFELRNRPGVSSPFGARDWVDGYSSATLTPYYNFGACENCEFAGPGGPSAENDWNRDHYWYVSWGIPNAWPLPLIYQERHAELWQSLSQYSATCSDPCLPSRSAFHTRLHFAGSFTQEGACKNQSCVLNGTSTDNSPSEGWLQLWNNLFGDPDTRIPVLEWSTDVTWEN